MKILTNNFYKFLFGFVGIVFVSLALILAAGALSDDENGASAVLNTAEDME